MGKRRGWASLNRNTPSFRGTAARSESIRRVHVTIGTRPWTGAHVFECEIPMADRGPVRDVEHYPSQVASFGVARPARVSRTGTFLTSVDAVATFSVVDVSCGFFEGVFMRVPALAVIVLCVTALPAAA